MAPVGSIGVNDSGADPGSADAGLRLDASAVVHTDVQKLYDISVEYDNYVKDQVARRLRQSGLGSG